MNKSPHTIKYTLASRLSQRLNQSLQESILFSTPKSNSNYFSPTLRCFNFFATAQPMQTRILTVQMINKKIVQLDTDERTPSANRRLAQWRVTWLIEQSTSQQLLWCIDSFVLRNPPLRQAPKR